MFSSVTVQIVLAGALTFSGRQLRTEQFGDLTAEVGEQVQ